MVKFQAVRQLLSQNHLIFLHQSRIGQLQLRSWPDFVYLFQNDFISTHHSKVQLW